MLRFLTVVLLVFALAGPGISQTLPSPSSREFAINNLTFALYHEVGHLLISEFSLPVLGKEEDAADNIATMLLLAKQGINANGALIDSARAWRMGPPVGTGKADLNLQIETAALYNSHSPDQVRAAQIGCLIVGSRRDVFAHVAIELGLEGADRTKCAGNLGQVIASWLSIKTRFIQSGTPAYPIEIIYDENDAERAGAQILRQSGLLEDVAKSVLTKYALPRQVSLRAASCGQANAFFDAATGEILICYELADFYLEMSKRVSG